MARLSLFWLCCSPAFVAGAGWEETDDTSLLQLSHANHQINQPDAAQPKLGQREDVHSEKHAAGGAEPAPARNVTEQKQIAPDINLVQMEKMVSDMERRRDDDEPDADSADSNTDVDDASGASGSWGDPEKTALETLKTALDLQFIPFLDAEHSADRREYIARTAVHQMCIKHNVEDNAAVTQAHDFLETKRDKHKACRKSQKSWNAYKSFAIGGSSCAGASDIQDMHEVYDKHEQLADLMQAAKTDAQTYASLALAGVKRDCAQDQQTYEEHWCAWRASKDESCTELQRCIVTVDLNDLKTKLETRADNRGKIWETVSQLQCRVEHLLSTFAGADETVSDFNTLDNCDDVVTDTSKYELSLEVPLEVSCSNSGDPAGDAIVPGGSTCSDWTAQRYSAEEGWSSTTHVVPATCQVASCPAGTPTTPPLTHEGCEGEPEECVFYNAHPDACGAYDTGSDIPSAACCACSPPASTQPPPAPTQPPATWSLPSDWNIHASSEYNANHLVEFIKVQGGYWWSSFHGMYRLPMPEYGVPEIYDPWSGPHRGEPFYPYYATLTFDAGQEVILTGFATAQGSCCGLNLAHPEIPNFINRGSSSFKDFKFSRSNDEVNFEEVLSGTGGNLNTYQRQEFSFPAATSQFWRLEMFASWGWQYGRGVDIQYIEFQVV